MSRRIWIVATLLLALGAVEFAGLGGLFSRADVPVPDVQRAYAVVFTSTPTPTLTSTGTPTPPATVTPTSTPFSPPVSPPPGTGSISGVITNPLGTPIAGAFVDADSYICCAGGGSTSTAADGSYAITGLAAGSYRVHADATSYALRYFDRTYAFDSAYPVHVTTGDATTGINIQLEPTGAITGTVRNQLGTPIAGAQLNIGMVDCCANYDGSTAADGTYLATGISPGSYAVQVIANGFPSQLYSNAYSASDATLVVVASGATTHDIDFILDSSGTIKGFVRDRLANPIAGAGVGAEADPCCNSGFATTKADGSYEIKGLAPVPHRLLAYATGFAGQFYDNTLIYRDAALVNVTLGQATIGIDFALAKKSTISGVVRDEANQPIAGAYVRAEDAGGSESSAISAADGSYQLDYVPPSDLRVLASKQGYVQEYFDNAPDAGAASILHITEDSTTTGIDFSLATGGHITGVVLDDSSQPLQYASVQARPAGCCLSTFSTTTDANGLYDIGNLATESYIVQAYRQNYIPEYYDNAYDQGSATPVGVTQGATTQNINFHLGTGGHIKGFVRDGSFAPIANVYVDASPTSCCAGGGSAWTLGDGSYDIGALLPGSYNLQAAKTGFASEYYDNVYDFNSAAPVTIVGTNTMNGINFMLDPGGTISGTVRDEAGVTPLADAFVSVQSVPCCAINGYAFTDAGGAYHIDDLPPGTYHASSSANLYGLEWFNNKTTDATADSIIVSAGGNASGTDFSLRLINPDNLIDATGIFAPSVSITNTTGFTNQASETQPCGGIGGTTWYSTTINGTPPVAGSWYVDTAGSAFDTVVAIYTGPEGATSPAQLTLLGCNDNAPGPQAKLTFTPLMHTTYYLQVGGHNAATGALQVSLQCTGDSDCDTFADGSDNCPSVWNYDQVNTDLAALVTAGVPQQDTSIANSDSLGDLCDDDDDNDGIPDLAESGATSPPGPCVSTPTDPLNPDTDADGVRDGAECALGSDPNDAASKPVVGGPDNDHDGLSNAFEALIASNPSAFDSDGDGISDGIEYKGYSTSPMNPNTDDDGCGDGREIPSIDGVSAVNSLDLQIVAKHFAEVGKWALDINKDGAINSLDLQLVAKNFNPASC